MDTTTSCLGWCLPFSPHPDRGNCTKLTCDMCGMKKETWNLKGHCDRRYSCPNNTWFLGCEVSALRQPHGQQGLGGPALDIHHDSVGLVVAFDAWDAGRHEPLFLKAQTWRTMDPSRDVCHDQSTWCPIGTQLRLHRASRICCLRKVHQCVLQRSEQCDKQPETTCNDERSVTDSVCSFSFQKHLKMCAEFSQNCEVSEELNNTPMILESAPKLRTRMCRVMQERV